jgi:hypothetical protein
VAIVAVPVQLLAPGSAMASATPSDVFSDNGDHRSQIVFTGLLDADGVTPVPDGAKVALATGNCFARNPDSTCIFSAGGSLLSAGTTPGDGTPSPSNGSFFVFTVAGGQVRAVYSDLNVTSTVNQTQVANVAAVPADINGNVLVNTSFAVAAVQLRGATSAVASGPATLSLAGGTGTVTFSGIKDSAGNTVPDGTVVAVATGNCITRDLNSNCNFSSGGTIVDGTTSSSNSAYKTFTVTNGSVTVTYSTAGASVGTATVQLAPARPDTSVIANTSLIGGTWAITVTN